MGSRDGWRLLLLLLGFLLVAPTCRAREAQPLPVLEEEEVVADAAGGRGGAGAAAGGGNRRAPVRHELSLDFYAKTCPAVDQIVGNVTAPRFRDNPGAGPAVLRLFYHDCFVEGCDASILIAPTANNGGGAPRVERDMEENRNLPQEAFDTVEMAKAAVEKACPGVVTCADVLALAARDFVHLAGGPYYAVKKGRKDSRVSLAGKVRGSLPRANSTVDELLRVFAAKGLGAGDLVALSGAHTVGFAHCAHFLGRLYDFGGTRQPDPVMDARLVKALRMSCPYTGGSARVVVPFDVSTPFQFDHAYYANLQARLGLLGSDQALFLDARTRPLVEGLAADRERFFQAFAASMDRMGSVRVKKGRKGEVRRVCSQHLS
ncbi:peroxidase 19-like [Oryza glaberrima]|uniref:peroxidase 19-like n=1 Tax=Oryza glaberrima TaxID=4538 RepID=UPI00224C0401|nr:peroxidase 19-like [Oryza glaberrima]